MTLTLDLTPENASILWKAIQTWNTEAKERGDQNEIDFYAEFIRLVERTMNDWEDSGLADALTRNIYKAVDLLFPQSVGSEPKRFTEPAMVFLRKVLAHGGCVTR